MPAPTNISAATAIDLGSFPASVTQDVYDAGTTYTVWYKFTAAAGQNYAGVWGYGGLGETYSPTLTVWTGTPPILTGHPVDFPISVQNKPCQFPVVPGTTYYLKFTKNGDIDPSNLAIEAEYPPTDDAVAGDILVNDDIDGFGAVIFDPATDYTIRRFVFPIIAGEGGDVIESTIRYLFSSIANGASSSLELYDADFAMLVSIPFTSNGVFTGVRANQAQSLFYVTDMGNGSNNAKIYTVDISGTLTLIATLDNRLRSYNVASNNAGTILYASGVGSFDSAVRRWDVGGASWLSDLAATVTDYEVRDILVLTDDTILVLYDHVVGAAGGQVIHYDTDGTVLHTYNTFCPSLSFVDRLASATDDPTSFWVWTQYGTGVNFGKNDFWNITIATGAIAIHRIYALYNGGNYGGPVTDSPYARFGNSNSCPFVIVRDATTPIATITVNKVVSPSSNTTSFDFTAGGGLSPSSFSLAHGEAEVFNPVTPGSGYSIEETADPLFTTEIVVSNGDDPSNITVGEGDNIVVTVTNTLIPPAGGGIYKIVPGKRNDTIYDGAGGTYDTAIPRPFGKSGLIGD